jgi:SAM-dependent methyltransferase
VLSVRKAPDWKSGETYYQHLENGYDILAPLYDGDIGSNLIGNRMRSLFRDALRETFRPGQHVFEIGCGTGIEALWLARQGLDVVATDVSQRMLDRVQLKAHTEGLAERIHCRKLAAREIGALAEEFGRESFDGGYCHAGALNMEPAIFHVPPQVRALIKRRGAFVCSVINKTSLFEVLFYSLILRPRKAFRRMGNVVPIPIARVGPLKEYVIPARFYSPRDIAQIFQDGFTLENARALEVFLPPSNLTNIYERFGVAFRPIELLENRLSRFWPVNTWGHHTLFTLRRW